MLSKDVFDQLAEFAKEDAIDNFAFEYPNLQEQIDEGAQRVWDRVKQHATADPELAAIVDSDEPWGHTLVNHFVRVQYKRYASTQQMYSLPQYNAYVLLMSQLPDPEDVLRILFYDSAQFVYEFPKHFAAEMLAALPELIEFSEDNAPAIVYINSDDSEDVDEGSMDDGAID